MELIHTERKYVQDLEQMQVCVVFDLYLDGRLHAYMDPFFSDMPLPLHKQTHSIMGQFTCCFRTSTSLSPSNDGF